MAYKVYYTDVPLPPGVSEPNFFNLIPFAFDTRDLALEKAFKMIEHGAIVWKIEAPNGIEMSRTQIERAFEVKKRAALWPPATATSTGGMPHKQHWDRSKTLPPKPSRQRRTP
jgi:hypothetical protein